MSQADELLALANSIALRAGELLMARPDRFTLAEKSGALDFATQMDLASEELIVSLIKAARPDDAILGEEGGNHAGSSGFTWVIDPIDGTVNYLYGMAGWCVSIAVKDASGPLVGVVYAPSISLRWSAVRGGGAFCNDLPIRCNEPVPLDKALIATGFSYDRERRVAQASLIAKLLPKIRDIRRNGACAVDICMVASGMVDAHFESGVNEWDHAAAGLVATEAGARLVVIEGVWAGKQNFVLAAGPSLFEQLVPELEAGLDFPL